MADKGGLKMNQKTKAKISYFDKLESNTPPVTVVWHARGNQGAVGASSNITDLVALLIELHSIYDATSAPIFGAAKEGEPIRVYNRIGKDPIEVFYTPTKLDVIIIVDPSIARNILLQGAHKDTVYLINTDKDPEKIARELKLGGRRIVTVNATKIAREELKTKRSHPNTTMLGALIHIFPFFTQELMAKTIEKTYEEKGHAVVSTNQKAMERGYAEVVEFDGRKIDIPWEEIVQPKLLAWYEILPGGAMPAVGNFSLNKTGTWRTERPVWDPEKCIHCLSCIPPSCPDDSIFTKIGQDGLKEFVGFDYDHCKGCGVCANICPVKAIRMISESEAKNE
jgi:2-oxoacid:acceptor oxidoreductase gamma subunit (pyruvate/2-ketoisovalerate family)/2-oxoacid:acceptor oxidoreductase delta subunit (pyruvate/2-ketoisovalerate family)